VFIPPTTPTETKTVNNQVYQWCTKCNRGNGQWVQAHTTDTHVKNFKPPFKPFKHGEQTKKPGILKQGGFTPKPDKTTEGSGKVSFLNQENINAIKQASAQM
jgi:hypothetical protein